MTATRPQLVVDVLAQAIVDAGVSLVPVFQGGNIMYLIDAIGRHESLSYFCPTHEQSLSMIVESMARLNGLAVGVVTSGPGATNLATGIADAYYDSIPCVFIAGQVGMYHIKGDRRVRQRGYQECNTIDIYEPITKWSHRLESPEDALPTIQRAFSVATTGRPGPVFLELPFNVQRSQVSCALAADKTDFCPVPRIKDLRLSEYVETISEELQQSSYPLVIVGGGIWLSSTQDILRKLIKNTNLPVATTWPGHGILSYSFESYLGPIGRSGTQQAYEALRKSDLIIGLGCRFNPKITNEALLNKEKKVISVDIDPDELADSLCSLKHLINADLSELLPLLSERLLESSFKYGSTDKFKISPIQLVDQYESQLTAESEYPDGVNPHKFFNALSTRAKRSAIYTLDTGCNLTWAIQSLLPSTSSRYISAYGHSPMGFALPAAIGAALARPDNQVIAVCGDGGFLLNIQDLHTISTHEMNIKIFVINNYCLSNTRLPSISAFEGRAHANDRTTGYYPINIEAAASGFDIPYQLISRESDFYKLDGILSDENPIVVEVLVPEDFGHDENW